MELPILFYLDPAINYDVNLKDCEEIFLTYHFYPSADQTIAEVLQLEIEKHQKNEQALLVKKQELVAKGVKGLDMQAKSNLAPGYNPKDQPEMFVRKILSNQKRMKHTIDEYVKEHKLDPLEKRLFAKADKLTKQQLASKAQ